MHSPYEDDEHISEALKEGRHRDVIGGLWDELGKLQLDWLVSRGLMPSHRLLDVGCGSLRLGTVAVPYLDAGHYFGTDLNEYLMQAGYDAEIADKDRLPRENLMTDGTFSFSDVPENMDYLIATSVFTHLPFNHLRRALLMAKARFHGMKAFHFTVFLTDDKAASLRPFEQKGGIWTHDVKDPYHYFRDDLAYLAGFCGYDIAIHDWGHPRNQMMCVARPSTS